MNIDELMELEQDITKAKCIADIFFAETAEATETIAFNKEYHKRFADLASILVDYLAAAKQEIERLEVMINGKN